jgi:uncharacterized protein (UPF0276 family)
VIVSTQEQVSPAQALGCEISDRPAVGLLYNPATPQLIARAPELIEFLSIMPDRLWFDFGPGSPDRRFHRALGAIEAIRRFAEGRMMAGHGIGLSLPSAIPLDEEFVSAVATMSSDLGCFQWFSEHLSVFITPKGSVPNAQAGLGLPLAYDDESYEIVSSKLKRLNETMQCRQLLENGAFFMPVPDSDMSEPEFLTRLYRNGVCGTLLDLHNLHVSARNSGVPAADYISALDPAAVEEIHLGGGDDFAGFYMDSHSSLTPPEVWQLAFDHAPRFPNLRAITFEFQETYFDRIGVDALIEELERMHGLAAACRRNSAHAR